MTPPVTNVEQHIHIHVDVEQLRAVGEEIAASTQQIVIPPGYKCQECFSDDGSHSSSCSLFTREVAL